MGQLRQRHKPFLPFTLSYSKNKKSVVARACKENLGNISIRREKNKRPIGFEHLQSRTKNSESIDQPE